MVGEMEDGGSLCHKFLKINDAKNAFYFLNVSDLLFDVFVSKNSQNDAKNAFYFLNVSDLLFDVVA
jgi:hypothetical protein